MDKNLLIVFGGTQEGSKDLNTFQSVFDENTLQQQSVDVLQFNLLTERPSVTWQQNDKPGSSTTTLLSGTSKDAVPNKRGTNFDDPMRQLELKIENVNWVDGTASLLLIGSNKATDVASDGVNAIASGANKILGFFTDKKIPKIPKPNLKRSGSAPGMTPETYLGFSDRSSDVIFSLLETENLDYENIIVIGHSRGAALATRVADALYANDKYKESLLRLVLQDPVSKNVGETGDNTVVNEGREVVKKLADAGKEVHIIAKTDLNSNPLYNYETYAPELLGTRYHYGGKENRIDDSVGNEPDMRNVYFHLAKMEHGYMLQGSNGKDDGDDYIAFHDGFTLGYENIISTEPWTKSYFDDREIDIDLLANNSELLRSYYRGEYPATPDNTLEPINQIPGFPADPLSDYYNEIHNINTRPYKTGLDRQHALVHNLAYKALIPTLKIEVSDTEVNEGDAPQIEITATSNRTFADYEQVVSFRITPNSLSSIATPYIGSIQDGDYAIKDAHSLNPLVGFTIEPLIAGEVLIPAGSNKGTMSLEVLNDDLIEENEKIKININNIATQHPELGSIDGIVSDKNRFLEITIIDDDKSSPITSSNQQNGSASNGLLVNATAFIDTNGNFQPDAGETQTTTDNNGEYSLLYELEELDSNGDGQVDPQEAQIVVIGGKDTSTGLPGEIPLISQISSTGDDTSTTPLTTLKAVLSAEGIAEAEVETLLNKIAGFSLESLSQPLDNFAPYSAIGSGDDPKAGIDIASGHVKIMNLLLNGTSFLEAAGYKKSDGQIQVINALGEVLKTANSFDLSKNNDLRKFYNQLTEQLELSVNNKTITALSTLVADSNNLINELVEQTLSSSVNEVLPSISPIKKAVYSSLPNLTEQLVKGEITPQESQTQLQELLNADTFLVEFNEGELLEFAFNEGRIVQVTASKSIKEGNKNSNGQFKIILREAAPPQGLKVLYTISGTATLGQDYQNQDGLFGEINIEPGATEAVIDLKVLDDKISESTESVTINLQYVGDSYVLDPVWKTATLEIADNDKGNNSATKNGIEKTGSFDDDKIAGQEKDDQLFGSYGDDLLNGRGGDDKLMGGPGNDTVRGGDDNDDIEGNFGEDVLEGNAGDDVIAGGSEDDALKGGPGNDLLHGDAGDDLVEGNSGNDVVKGGTGNDTLEGNQDNDWLVGEAGEDILKGGPGVDLLNGGEGADVFYFEKPSDGGDLIIDFDPAQGDKIQISRSGFKVNSLKDFKVIAGTLEFKGQEIALIQNQGQTYNNFAELGEILEIVGEAQTQPTPEQEEFSIEIKPRAAKVASVANPKTTILDEIIKRGQIKVATSGNGSEFDLEFAGAIAAAVFGDATKVKPVTGQFSKSFELVADGKADLAAQRTTQTLGRDAELNVDFSPTYFFDHQGIVVRNDSSIENATDLKNKTIGVLKGSTALSNLQNVLGAESIKFTPELFDTEEEMITAYDDGEIDAYSTDRAVILENLDQLSNPENHRLLDVELSKEPISMVLPENDSQWADVVRWVNYVPVQAEEFGISSENIAEFIALNTDDDSNNDSAPAIRRFLGIEGDLGKSLGLSNSFAVNVIQQVGNYGEIYERHFPGVDRDRNSLWTDGGMLYSPPFSGSEIELELKNNDNRDLVAKIKQRGVLKLGLPGNNPGLAAVDEGEYKGFDVDLGKAIAAALFQDPDRLEVTIQPLQDSFGNTANGVVDVSAMGITQNLVRDASWGIDFSPTYLYTGQGVLVRNNSGITVLPALNGRRVGVLEGASGLQNIQDAISELGGDIIPVEFATNDEMFAAYDAGEIDAVTTDMTILNGRVGTLSNPNQHRILDDTLSKEPLGLIVDENQSEWKDIVGWVTNALVQAEEYGITSKNVERLIKKNLDDNPNNDSDPAIRQFLGIEGNIGKVLGLPNDFAANIIKAVGNYGEIYERNFDSDVLRREQNELLGNFGLQYAPPLGSEVSPQEQEELGNGDDVYEIQPSTRKENPDGFKAGAGNDKVTGSMRDDTVDGGQGNDTIAGNDGEDIVTSGSGMDRIYGQDGNDNLQGGPDNDNLFGGAGEDVISGGIGRDRLNGGPGNDILTGGASIDRFIFATNEPFDAEVMGSDRITDFNPGQDIILLDKKTFTALKSNSGEGFSVQTEFASVANGAGTSEAFIVYNSNNGKLFYNEDGSKPGFGFGGEFATLVGKPDISADDFWVR